MRKNYLRGNISLKHNKRFHGWGAKKDRGRDFLWKGGGRKYFFLPRPLPLFLFLGSHPIFRAGKIPKITAIPSVHSKELTLGMAALLAKFDAGYAQSLFVGR